MKQQRRTIDKFSVEWATDHGKAAAEGRISASLRYIADQDKITRVDDAVECKWCFYFATSRIGGAAMTTWECGVCSKEQMSGNTNCPTLCDDCGKTWELCTNCGGDLHGRVRRKKPLPGDTP